MFVDFAEENPQKLKENSIERGYYRYRQKSGQRPTRYRVFFAAQIPWFNQGTFWVVKPLKSVFYFLKGRDPLKKSKKSAEL
jgi:hypothetical protein